MPAIRLQSVSKMFKLYDRPSDLFWETLMGRARFREFWALRDISLEVAQGEVLGIVGRNGAGKSTLLKIITGKLDVTDGSVNVRGRVASILELGTGFSGEYSGRENVALGGLMIGLTREEVAAKMDWIIDFAEVRAFIDQPFRTYSTGMQARLTFSTAICVNPDVLVVDEALAVGDAKFQLKCYNEITAIRNSGKTIVLVTHDTNSVSTFCDRAILMEGGRIVEAGAPRHVAMVYFQRLFHENAPAQPSSPSVEPPSSDPPSPQAGGSSGLQQPSVPDPSEPAEARVGAEPAAPPTENVHELRVGTREHSRLLDFGIRDESGKIVHLLESGGAYTLFARALFLDDVPEPIFGFLIRNQRGVDMFGADTRANYQVALHRAGDVLEGRLHVRMWLTNGDYFLSGGVGQADGTVFDYRYDGYHFSIPRIAGIQFASVVNLQHRFDSETTRWVETQTEESASAI